MSNDYTKLAQDIQDAENATETAYYNTDEADIQVLLDDAREKLAEARKLAEERA